ncbi:MAG: BlaI family penicillinase repressor [Planctomycetota bacterium]|jgi:BlaI family penicillinase repressor
MTPPRKRQDKNAPAITEAELPVLKSFWDHGPATVRELIERLDTDSAYTTVQTLVTRLVEKGHVRADRRGLAHVFAATTVREELAHRRVEEVASSLLDGATAPLVLRLVENGKFSADDIKSFRKLLKAAEQKSRGEQS